MILFLDFDGVLHPDPCFDATRLFERAPQVAAVLEAFPEASIVLSTAWRSQLSLSELIGPLPATLRERVIDVTPEFSLIDVPPHLVPYRRQAECVHWLHANGGSTGNWIALDDRPSLFAPYCEHLIVCDSNRGFGEEDAGRLHGALVRSRRSLLDRVDALI